MERNNGKEQHATADLTLDSYKTLDDLKGESAGKLLLVIQNFPAVSPLDGPSMMNAQEEMDLATGNVAWELVIQYHYPIQIVAEHLQRTPEEICHLLLVVLEPDRLKPMH